MALLDDGPDRHAETLLAWTVAGRQELRGVITGHPYLSQQSPNASWRQAKRLSWRNHTGSGSRALGQY
jgi:hypothetical protein